MNEGNHITDCRLFGDDLMTNSHLLIFSIDRGVSLSVCPRLLNVQTGNKTALFILNEAAKAFLFRQYTDEIKRNSWLFRRK